MNQEEKDKKEAIERYRKARDRAHESVQVVEKLTRDLTTKDLIVSEPYNEMHSKFPTDKPQTPEEKIQELIKRAVPIKVPPTIQ